MLLQGLVFVEEEVVSGLLREESASLGGPSATAGDAAAGHAAGAAAMMAPAPSISREIESSLFDMDDLQTLLKTVRCLRTWGACHALYRGGDRQAGTGPRFASGNAC